MSAGVIIIEGPRTAIAGSPSGPTLVQDKANSTTAHSTLDVAFDATTTAVNSLFAIITHTTASNIVSVVTDNVDSLTPTTGGPSVNGVVTEIWYLHNGNINGVNNITLDVDASDDLTMTIVEVTPLNNAAEESYNSNTGTSGAVTTNSVTPSSAKNFVIAVGSWGLNDYSSGPTNGFVRGAHAGGGGAWQEVAYLSQSSATSKSTGWSLSASINWASAIAVFGAP